MTFVPAEIFGDTNSPSYAQIIGDGCSYSQKLLDMQNERNLCSRVHEAHLQKVLLEHLIFVRVYNKIQTLKLSGCQWRETPFIRPGKVMRIATGYQLDSKVMHTKLEFSTL
jgi:hypothetical protein